jgi:peroxiredoxin
MLYLPILLRLVIADPALPPGTMAPPVVVQRLGGKVETLRLKGHRHLLVFFASWCRRCPPYLTYLARDGAVRRAGVEVVPIDLLPSELPGEVETFWHRLRAPAPLYLDRYGEIADAYQVTDLPTVVLIGRDGRIKGALMGVRAKKDVLKLLQLAEG